MVLRGSDCSGGAKSNIFVAGRSISARYMHVATLNKQMAEADAAHGVIL